jgi:hypothetical protein
MGFYNLCAKGRARIIPPTGGLDTQRSMNFPATCGPRPRQA